MSYGFRKTTDDVEFFLKKYSPIVQRISYKMVKQEAYGMDVQDLIQAGMMCLVECRSSFDPKTGVPIDAFITQKVKWAVVDEMRKHDWVPRSTRLSHKEIQKAIKKLEKAGHHKPGEEVIAAEMSVSVEKYRKMLQDSISVQIIHYDEVQLGADDDSDLSGGELLDRLIGMSGELDDDQSPSQELERSQSIGALSRAVSNLPEREQLVVSLYFDEDLTFREISEVLDISIPRVHQIKSQAISRLRASILQ